MVPEKRAERIVTDMTPRADDLGFHYEAEDLQKKKPAMEFEQIRCRIINPRAESPGYPKH